MKTRHSLYYTYPVFYWLFPHLKDSIHLSFPWWRLCNYFILELVALYCAHIALLSCVFGLCLFFPLDSLKAGIALRSVCILCSSRVNYAYIWQAISSDWMHEMSIVKYWQCKHKWSSYIRRVETEMQKWYKEESIQEAESQAVLKLIKGLTTTTCVQIMKRKQEKYCLGQIVLIILDIGI